MQNTPSSWKQHIFQIRSICVPWLGTNGYDRLVLTWFFTCLSSLFIFSKTLQKEGIEQSITWNHCQIWRPSGGSRIFQMGGRCFVTNGGTHILFSGKKCMKLKEIGLKWGGARLLAPCYSKITIFLWIILNSIMKTSYFTYFENNLLKRPPGSLGAMVLLQNCSFDT